MFEGTLTLFMKTVVKILRKWIRCHKIWLHLTVVKQFLLLRCAAVGILSVTAPSALNGKAFSTLWE